MGYFAGARDIRNLLAVATMLRRLSQDAGLHDDEMLYRTAAQALESRARLMADGQRSSAGIADLHAPVNLTV